MGNSSPQNPQTSLSALSTMQLLCKVDGGGKQLKHWRGRHTTTNVAEHVLTFRGVLGRSALAVAAAMMLSRSCTKTRRAPRKGGLVRDEYKPDSDLPLSNPFKTKHLDAAMSVNPDAQPR